MERDKYRIFVVDDEGESANIIASSLTALTDHSVTSFDEPHKALEAFIDFPSDLVITDLNMPRIDGFEMIEQMKDRNINTDFIVVTGNKTVKSVVHSRWLGVAYLFFKPVNVDGLMDAVETMYRRQCYWEERIKDVRGSQIQ